MPENNKKFIIDIAPLTRIPLTRQQHFSYLYHEKIPKGSLVSIPLFRRMVQGIVVNSRSDFHRLGNFKLRKVIEIVEPGFITENQFSLAEFISDYYLSPLGITLKKFIPNKVKERAKDEKKKIKKEKNIKLTKDQEEIINKINTKSSSPFLLFGPASSGKTDIYIEAIKKLRKGEQALILVPELTLTPQAIERYGAHFGSDEMVLLTSKISKGKFYSYWEKIRSGKAKVIIGTRISVFAPFQNLKLIVIDEEQDISFKQWDMHPRYDTRKVAEKLAEIGGAKLIFGSATPSIETYQKAKSKKYSLLKLPHLKQNMTNIEIVDMRRKKWEKKFGLISDPLKSEIQYALENKMQSILFINRQGMSAFSICADCRTVLRCPKCSRALVYESEGHYKCLHCTHKTDIFVSCSGCKGTTFKNIGIGTQKVEKEIRKMFPEARIRKIDQKETKKSGEQEKIYDEFSQGKIDILIGTQMITKGWDLPRVGLVGIIDADSLLSIPDFKTDEKAFQNIVQVIGRTGRMESKFPGKAVIQTYDPDNLILKSAAKMDYEGFYENEVGERKSLAYPPFGKLIKLVCQDKSGEALEKVSENIYKKIVAIQGNSKNSTIFPPQNSLVEKVRGRFRKQIIIKIKGTNAKIPPRLKKELVRLGKGWTIDVDPISIT